MNYWSAVFFMCAIGAAVAWASGNHPTAEDNLRKLFFVCLAVSAILHLLSQKKVFPK